MSTTPRKCMCQSAQYGFDCVCDWVEKHPGSTEYVCDYCGTYSASKNRCNICQIIRPDTVILPSDDHQLRQLLWLRHGCSFYSLYGDDGEMQCAECCIDFKRNTPDQISQRWKQIAIEKFEKQKAGAPKCENCDGEGHTATGICKPCSGLGFILKEKLNASEEA